jgi:hypothetical protein
VPGVKTFGLIAVSVLLLCTCFANEEVVEIGNVQVAKALSGTVADPTDAPIPGVQVIEVTSDWKTTIRNTVTDNDGRWSLAPVAHQKLYYIRLVKGAGFNELRFRVRIDSRKGKALRMKLPLA